MPTEDQSGGQKVRTYPPRQTIQTKNGVVAATDPMNWENQITSYGLTNAMNVTRIVAK